MRTKWTKELLRSEIKAVCDAIGRFPSTTELRSMGRNDLACKISKSGGFVAWSKLVAVDRTHSDSDTGWDGEIRFAKHLEASGFKAERMEAVKSPFDIMVEDVLRVDVKSSRFASHGPCHGWFYRIGKAPQADVIVLFQLDTDRFYVIPWWDCPRTNITISRDGGKYAAYLGRLDLLRDMIATRANEKAGILATCRN